MSTAVSLTLAIGVLAVAVSAPSSASELRESADGEGRLVLTNVSASAPAGMSASGESSRRAQMNERRRLYRPLIEEAARRYHLSRRMLEAVIEVESGYNPAALSKKGAQGLMQLMPDTARHLGVVDVWDPAHNIDGGARYLREMLDRFEQNQTFALAAYNAGPGAVERAGGVPRFSETVDYVGKVRRAMGGGYGRAVTAVRDGGTLRLTNTGHTQSSLRLMRSQGGSLVLTNR